MSAIFSHPTPNKLLEYIRAATGNVSPVTLLKPGSEALPPVFAIHDVSGDVLAYLQLARLLRGPRTVYGVRARGLHAAALRDDTIEDMAESAIAAVRSVQASGPYSFVGYSFGGLVAYEMACRLTAAGQEVSDVVLLTRT